MSTDLYTEFKKILRFHEAYTEKKKSLEDIYGGKVLGQTIEKQLDQLEQVGWVEKSIGARKLKGLEAPETIWLIYPKPLAPRLKMIADNDNGHVDNTIRKFEAGGITNESAWRLRLVSLRLERICSFYTGYTGNIPTEKETGFSKSSNQNQSFFAFKEKDVLEFMDHLITRIENCVAVLIVRQKVANKSDGLVVGNIGELMDDFLSLLSLVNNMKSGNLQTAPIASNERQPLLIEEIPNETTN
ncbi:unnamed protein product [[Candida] boidinii]|nr:unnamed protein product [[Candida] boidinii]